MNPTKASLKIEKAITTKTRQWNVEGNIHDAKVELTDYQRGVLEGLKIAKQLTEQKSK